MAVRVLTTNGTFSSGTWRRCEAAALTFDASSGGNYDDTSTERIIPVTFANAGNQVGLVILCKILSVASGTLTIKLQNAAGSTTYTTDTFTVNTTFDPITANGSSNTQIFYFPLTSAAVVTGAGNYRYSIKCDVASRVQIGRTATAGQWLYACVLDVDTSNPSNGDTIIIGNDCTLTQTSAFTFGATDTHAFLLCEGSVWNVSSAAGPYTITFQGTVIYSNDTAINVGTSTVPIPISGQVTFDLSGLPSTWWFDAGHYGTTGYCINVFNFYGEKGAALSTRAFARAEAGQADIVTETDVSGTWNTGDSVILFGKGKTTTANDTIVYTITNIVGTTLTLNANLDFFLYKKGGILNTTRATTQCGIVFTGKATLTLFRMYTLNAWIASLNMQGCYINNMMVGWAPNVYDTTSTLSHVYAVATSTMYTLIAQSGNQYRHRLNVDNYFGTLPGNGVGLSFNLTSNGTFDTIFIKGGVNMLYGQGVGNTFTKLAIGPGCNRGASWYCVGMVGAAYSFSDSLMAGNGYAFTNQGSSIGYMSPIAEADFSDCILDNAGVYTVNLESNATGIRFKNCLIGDTLTGGTNDVRVGATALVQARFVNCGIGANGVGDVTAGAPGSYVRLDTYDKVANDHRCYEQRGKFQSTGDGLTDTTVHTSGAGKFAVRFEPQFSTNRLAWVFPVPTGNILGRTMTVAVWCKVNAAAFYAGVHLDPRLSVLYDNATTVSSTAAESTDWQLLSVTFTPTTAYGEITVTLDAATDATTTDAYVYWDDMAVLYPAGYQLDLGAFDVWASALPVTPPIATNLSALSVWTAQQAAGYGAGSFGNLLNTNVDAKVSEAGGEEFTPLTATRPLLP